MARKPRATTTTTDDNQTNGDQMTDNNSTAFSDNEDAMTAFDATTEPANDDAMTGDAGDPAPVSESEQDAEGDATTEPSDAEPTDEPVSGDPARAEFTLDAATVEGTNAREAHGDAITLHIIRFKRGSYVARAGRFAYPETTNRNATAAVRAALKRAEIAEKEVIYDADAAEKECAPLPAAGAGDNSANAAEPLVSEEMERELRPIEENVRAAEAKLSGADKDTREGWRAFGRAYLDARKVFDTKYGGAENEKRNNAAWGWWLLNRFAGMAHVEAILASKNAAGQAGRFAAAPDEIVNAVGVNTASTFEKNVNAFNAELARVVGGAVFAELREIEGADLKAVPDAKFAEAAERITGRWTEEFDKALAAFGTAARDAAMHGKPVPVFAHGKNRTRNLVCAWLVETNPSKVIAAARKAYEDARDEPSKEEKAIADTQKAATEVKKSFGQLSEDHAAVHLLNILLAHPNAADVYNLLGDKLEEHFAKTEAAKAANEAAQEKAAAGETAAA